jgi:endonuclease YncB( thermonuclease family)
MSPSARRTAASFIGLVFVVGVWWWVTAEPDSDVAQGPPAASTVWSVVSVIDGDTFDAERDGTRERVRVIGIDTPEREQCGYAEASAALTEAIGGGSVTLVSGAETDRDTYGRLLRYVEVDGADVGLDLIERGLAVARYDSRSGQPHDRELTYWVADDASADLCG